MFAGVLPLLPRGHFATFYGGPGQARDYDEVSGTAIQVVPPRPRKSEILLKWNVLCIK